MGNKAFQRALNGLSHPLAVAAILLMVVNDHILKPYAPSWLAGKLSDFAWLLFVPLLIAAAAALIVPGRAARQARVVGLLAFSTSGLTFTLLKTSPSASLALSNFIMRLAGVRIGTVSDPTDLWTLPALGLGGYVWIQTRREIAHFRKRQLAWLGLAALVALADAPMPNRGITCIQQPDDSTLSAPGYAGQEFLSKDGGITWQPGTPAAQPPETCGDHPDAWDLTDHAHSGVRYRFIPGVAVDRSQDSGQTWQREIDLLYDEPRTFYYHKNYSNEAQSGPFDALFDARSGNLVVAMGFEGVLVRKSDGRWVSAAVGEYHREEMTADKVAGLISGEIWLAVVASVLALATLALLVAGSRWWHSLPLLLAWMLWGAGVLLSPAAISTIDYVGPPLFWGCTVMALAVSLIWAAFSIKRIRQQLARQWATAGLMALGGAMLFLLPYVLWGAGILARYAAAPVIGTSLLVVSMAGGGIALRRRQASRPPAEAAP